MRVDNTEKAEKENSSHEIFDPINLFFFNKCTIEANNVINEVGYPIILDSVSNMSFGALLFSSFIPVQYVGGLMVFAMFSTSFGTLTLLASIVHLLKKNKLIRSKIS